MARFNFFNPLPQRSFNADDPPEPEYGYKFFPTADKARKAPNALSLEAPPTLQRDSRSAREGGLLAALGALLGGRADLAGGFGASYMGGVRKGEDDRFARSTQQWQQQRQNDLALNQNKMQIWDAEGREDQRSFSNKMQEAGNLFRWGQADQQRQQRGIGNNNAELVRQDNVLRRIATVPEEFRAGLAEALQWPKDKPLPKLPAPTERADPLTLAWLNAQRQLLSSPNATPELRNEALGNINGVFGSSPAGQRIGGGSVSGSAFSAGATPPVRPSAPLVNAPGSEFRVQAPPMQVQPRPMVQPQARLTAPPATVAPVKPERFQSRTVGGFTDMSPDKVAGLNLRSEGLQQRSTEFTASRNDKKTETAAERALRIKLQRERIAADAASQKRQQDFARSQSEPRLAIDRERLGLEKKRLEIESAKPGIEKEKAKAANREKAQALLLKINEQRTQDRAEYNKLINGGDLPRQPNEDDKPYKARLERQRVGRAAKAKALKEQINNRGRQMSEIAGKHGIILNGVGNERFVGF